MAQETEVPKVASAPSDLPQTVPAVPSRRDPRSEFSVSIAGLDDVPKIVEGLYTCFGPDYWDRKEPLALRPQSDAIRRERMVKRLIPTFSNSLIRWVIAKSIHTGEIVACACWIAPGNPIYGALRKSAVDFYGWRELYNCSDEEFEELWSHVDDEKWSGNFANYDAVRKEVLGDEPHWYLASLFTWPEWQGKGAGKLLLDWAIEQADANDPPTPLYLESAPTARAFYIRYGFVPTGEQNLVRRGPTIEKV